MMWCVMEYIACAVAVPLLMLSPCSAKDTNNDWDIKDTQDTRHGIQGPPLLPWHVLTPPRCLSLVLKTD